MTQRHAGPVSVRTLVSYHHLRLHLLSLFDPESQLRAPPLF